MAHHSIRQYEHDTKANPWKYLLNVNLTNLFLIIHERDYHIPTILLMRNLEIAFSFSWL